MPRVDDPRVVVRMSPEGMAAVQAAADLAGVSVGGLVRECAERYAASVARDVREGSVRIRRNRAVRAVRGQVAPASSLVPRVAEGAALLALERQARINVGVERSRHGGKS